MNTCFCCVDLAAVRAPINEEQTLTKECEDMTQPSEAARAPTTSKKNLLKKRMEDSLETAGERVGSELLKAYRFWYSKFSGGAPETNPAILKDEAESKKANKSSTADNEEEYELESNKE